MNTQQLDEKEISLKEQFNREQQEATVIEEQIKALQAKYQEKLSNMLRIQGAFALLKELKTAEETKGDTPEKK